MVSRYTHYVNKNADKYTDVSVATSFATQKELEDFMRIVNESVMNFENALRGMRNPMNSWHKGDSYMSADGEFAMGLSDLKLAQALCTAGTDHRKFLRQILVSVDIEAPLYWWKEFDTYKVGTTANSTSTMHRLHTRPILITDFQHKGMTASS